MVSFILGIKGNTAQAKKALNGFKNEAEEYFAPFHEAMVLEGNYNLRIPCYNYNLVNPDTPLECVKGSPWVEEA